MNMLKHLRAIVRRPRPLPVSAWGALYHPPHLSDALVRAIVREELVEQQLRRENPPLDQVAGRRLALRAEMLATSEEGSFD